MKGAFVTDTPNEKPKGEVRVEQTPIKNLENHFTISGENIDDLLYVSLPRIRPASRAFYRKHIPESLQETGECLIDLHAGMGALYTLILRRDKMDHKADTLNGDGGQKLYRETVFKQNDTSYYVLNEDDGDPC